MIAGLKSFSPNTPNQNTMKTPNEEIQYLANMLTATVAEDTQRLLAIGQRITEIAHKAPLVAALQESEAGFQFAGADKEYGPDEFVPAPTCALRIIRVTLNNHWLNTLCDESI